MEILLFQLKNIHALLVLFINIYTVMNINI